MEFDEQYLTWIKEEFEKIKLSNDYAQEDKNRSYADLMTNLESNFSIPMFREDADQVDQKVFDLYQEISFARGFSIYD